MTGGAWTLGVTYNEATGLITEREITSAPALDVCINGNCYLPSETNLTSTTCNTAVTVFTIDYDAPSGEGSSALAKVRESLEVFVTHW